MQRGLRIKQNFYEDYSGYSEEQLDNKLIELGIDIDFTDYMRDMPIHEVKSIVIQNELFRLRDKNKINGGI